VTSVVGPSGGCLSWSSEQPSPRIAPKTAASLPGKPASISANPSSPSIRKRKSAMPPSDYFKTNIWVAGNGDEVPAKPTRV
jgi:hypothetical protein